MVKHGVLEREALIRAAWLLTPLLLLAGCAHRESTGCGTVSLETDPLPSFAPEHADRRHVFEVTDNVTGARVQILVLWKINECGIAPESLSTWRSLSAQTRGHFWYGFREFRNGPRYARNRALKGLERRVGRSCGRDYYRLHPEGRGQVEFS